MNPGNLKSLIKIISYIAVILLFTACATQPVKKVKPAEETKKPLSPEEQKKEKSIEVFTEILDVIETSESRKDALPKVESLYKKIIIEYPETGLAQESYWRLISIYVNDYSPADYEKAEALYGEFLEKYPQSPLKSFVMDSLGKGYYRDDQWRKLLTLTAPLIREYTQTGKRPGPSLISMNAEANYRLGYFDAAKVSYRVLIKIYPKLIESIKARARLKELKMRFD